MRYKNETKAYVESLNGIGNDLQQAMILKDSLLHKIFKSNIKTLEIKFKIMNLILRKSPNSLISILILERFVTNNTLSKKESKPYMTHYLKESKILNLARQ